jgi:hypothetical protein
MSALRTVDVPLSLVGERAPAWATSTRTTIDSTGPAEVVVTYESKPEPVAFGGNEGDQHREVTIGAVVTDWYALDRDHVERDRDVLVRFGGVLITIQQARYLAAELWTAANLAADAGCVL